MPEPAVARLGDFGPTLDPCLPSGDDRLIGLRPGLDPRPAGGPLRVLYGVRLI